jgi:hypothetical protein
MILVSTSSLISAMMCLPVVEGGLEVSAEKEVAKVKEDKDVETIQRLQRYGLFH